MSDLNALIAHGDWLSHCSIGEQGNLAEKANATVTGSNNAGAISGNTKDSNHLLYDFRMACREHLKLLLTLTPTSHILRHAMRHHSQLLNCSTVIFMGDWGDVGLELVAKRIISKD